MAITWYIDDKEVSNQNTSQLNQTFPYTDKTYMVRVKVIKTFGNNNNVITYESVNTPIQIGSAYDPKVTITPQKYPKQFDISVDLKNTGIKDNWSLKWEFPENFIINNTERLKANVTSKDWDISKQFKLIATPPPGTGEKPVVYSGTLKVPEMPYVTRVSYKFHPLDENSTNTIDTWVRYFNNITLPDGVQSIIAENGNIVWTCKNGYGTTTEVRDLSFPNRIGLPESLSGNKTSYYSSVYVKNNYELKHYGKGYGRAYNGGVYDDSRDYGLNCFILD
ncbi:hypothetical protein QIW49_08550 [Francisellaceae bacterium CB300]